MVLTLGLALVPASTKDRSNCLLARGMVHGDVEHVAGGMGLQTAKLVDQGLTGCPGEERDDDVRVNDIRKEVASFREPMDVIPWGLIGLLLTALEVPGIPRTDIHPLKILNEDPFEIRLVADAVRWKEFEPCSNMFPHADGEVLNDEVVGRHIPGFVSPVYLAMLVGGRKRCGNDAFRMR